MNELLTKESFLDQITRYGFFAEMIPKCFSSNSFADVLPTLVSSLMYAYQQKKRMIDVYIDGYVADYEMLQAETANM